VGGDADARRQKLGPRGGDREARSPLDTEAQVVEGALLRPVLDLGLRYGRAVVDVPERGRLDLVDLALALQVEEAPLRELAAQRSDRGVLELPVDREAEALPERLERLLVLGRERDAQLDEVLARDAARRLLAGRVVGHLEREAGLERHVRLAAHVEVVLHPPLGRQAVVVPAHRVEHVPAAHALVAREHVRLRVAEHVADVERAGHGRRRGVDHVARSRSALVEAVDAPLRPEAVPLLLGLPRLEVRTESRRVDGDDHGRAALAGFRSSGARP
jgi:hypothetical protein